MTTLDLDDVQGLIIRGYRKDFACHLAWRITEPRAFRVLLGELAAASSASDGGPSIMVARPWDPEHKPTHCVNIGFTFDGLKRLELDAESLDSFPDEFRAGADNRADEVCDTGPSAPDGWRPSLRSGDGAHVIVSVYADTADDLDDVIDRLRKRAGEAATEIDRFPAQRLGDVEHFGYRDGLSQPTIEGAPPPGIKDPFPAVQAGAFLLGQPLAAGPPWPATLAPESLGRNGSFAAFRMMRQEVEAFHAFLTTESQRIGIDEELLAAKMVGRWRTGEPLVLRPENGNGESRIPDEDLNDFDYEATDASPGSDHQGLLCPRGAHIRRAFPRSQRVVDDFDGLRRRIVRRAMPYGPAFDPARPTEEERGLVGMFICASLRDQFEYVMRHWLNDGLFTGGRLGRTRDPLTGSNEADGSRFVAPGSPDVETTGFPRFVTTRGCVYLFLPGIEGLKHIAGQG